MTGINKELAAKSRSDALSPKSAALLDRIASVLEMEKQAGLVYQTDVDGRAGDIRPTFEGALASLAGEVTNAAKTEARARDLIAAFPRPSDIVHHCDPVRFMLRAVASLAGGQRRIAIHDLSKATTEQTLVGWIHCLTEMDPTYQVMAALTLMKTGFSRKDAATIVHRQMSQDINVLRLMGRSDADVVAMLREVQTRMKGIEFVPELIDDQKTFLADFPNVVKQRFIEIADEIGL